MPLDLKMLSLYFLMYADDTVLFSDTPEGLQNLLNSLQLYCNKWKLSVNIDKTKIVIFRRGNRLQQNLHWQYDGNDVEIVNKFNYYLGLMLHYNAW